MTINKKNFHSLGHRLESFFCFCKTTIKSTNLFLIQLAYFITMSLMGYLALTSLSNTKAMPYKHLDLFFTSVSAITVSSLSTLEMEVFSNSQLVILTALMLLGGEVFISMLGIQFQRSKFPKAPQHITHDDEKSSTKIEIIESVTNPCLDTINNHNNHHQLYLKYNSIRYLSYVVLGYFLGFHILGSSLVFCYITLFPSPKQILISKGIKPQTFSIFAVVSSFSNCGFIPTNENMMVFKSNSSLLMILMIQVLVGNTLYPSCLWCVIWILGKVTRKREFSYLVKNPREIGYDYLLSGYDSALLALTVCGFILVQIILFSSMEWGSEALMLGLSSYQKFVASVFQVVNSRHAGESVFDLSTISSAIWVLFVIMMYLPPHTSFLSKRSQNDDKARTTLFDYLSLSHLTYLAIFVILICITEREQIKSDPLNFNVFNIIIEVISGYGNVGFSAGYSCKRQVNPSNDCVDKWYGFAGKWSPMGKCILIFVMIFGRLKKFSMNGGKAWKLS